MPKLSLTMVDARGRTTKRVYETAVEPDLLTYATVAQEFVDEQHAVTDLGVVRADLILENIAVGAAAVADSNIDVGATFSGFVGGGNGDKVSHKVPGIKNSLVAADGTIPIVGVVANYLENFETGEKFFLSDGEQVSSWIKGTLDR